MLKQRHSSQTLQEVHQDFVLGGQFTVSIQPRNAQNKDTTRIHCAFRCRHEGRRHDANCTLSTTNLRTTRQGLAFKKKILLHDATCFLSRSQISTTAPPPFSLVTAGVYLPIRLSPSFRLCLNIFFIIDFWFDYIYRWS